MNRDDDPACWSWAPPWDTERIAAFIRWPDPDAGYLFQWHEDKQRGVDLLSADD